MKALIMEAEWLGGVVTKLSHGHPCDRQQRHEAFGNHNTKQDDYKINRNTIAKCLNIICIHQEKRER